MKFNKFVSRLTKTKKDDVIDVDTDAIDTKVHDMTGGDTSATEGREMLESGHETNDENVTPNVIEWQKAVSQFVYPPLDSKEDLVALIGEERVRNIEKLITSEWTTITNEVKKII